MGKVDTTSYPGQTIERLAAGRYRVTWKDREWSVFRHGRAWFGVCCPDTVEGDQLWRVLASIRSGLYLTEGEI